MNHMDYRYGHLPVPGGGYVTGFQYHKKQPGILYCRTDIGGTYRYDFENCKWICLIDHITMKDPSEAFVSGIALDDNHPERLYVIGGTSQRSEGILAISDDYGDSFTTHTVPFAVHGNWNGRGCGSRLVVDPNNSDVLYFASQTSGLMRSMDQGLTWESLSIAHDKLVNETHDVFIFVCPVVVCDNLSQVLVLSTSGIDNATSNRTRRGHSMYISKDAGLNWQPLDMPESHFIENLNICGIVGHRYDFDGQYLYVTFSSPAPGSYIHDVGYSCDSGDCMDGRIVRYPILEDGSFSYFENITPEGFANNYTKEGINSCGFGGISSTPQCPGLLVTSTLCEKNPNGDMVFISKDYGDSWELRLHGLLTNNISFHTLYMKPEYNGNSSLIHWLSDIKINPFDSDDVVFNSGTGVFGTNNFTSPDVQWCDRTDGIEETVHLNIYSPHKGDVIALDIIGDLGGFAFTELDKQCENSFADAEGNRYITCLNADYSDDNPEFVIVTPRGNWTGKTKGGLIVSKDQCKTFDRIPLPYGLSSKLDDIFHHMEEPNINSGFVALSPDCKNIVWAVCQGYFFPMDCVIHSTNCGQSFKRSVFYDINKKTSSEGIVLVYSDRIHSNIFYAFSSTKKFYVSKDSGHTFYQKTIESDISDYPVGSHKLSTRAVINPEHGKSGIFYISTFSDGIFKYVYDIDSDEISVTRLTDSNVSVYCFGLGINKDNDYLNGTKAIYLVADIDGEYGIYLSTDECKTYTRINDDKHMYGEIIVMCGDSRTFGRFYMATGNCGLVYGEMA